MVVKVEEWRRLGGSHTLVGTTRREMVLVVSDCGTNIPPQFAANLQLNGSTSQSVSRLIPVQRGQTVTALLQATDANAGQTLVTTGNDTGVPGAQIWPRGNGAVEIEFTPPASLPDGTYYVTVTATDDACPVKGFSTQVVGFRVGNSPLKSRNQAARTLVSAYPNPFTDRVTFTLMRAADKAAVVLVVDQLGRVVDRLPAPAGSSPDVQVTWQPAAAVPAGVYLARFENGQQTARLLRVKP
ncbi:T9SS type A sorting domain-containing protein [Hymenobacter koreensis]|uniref:T9SS type A sorting domain-containing protein n=1 Tax=Hymenobacter koreensis TaxID=1084523 RepID=A0ABP8JLM6_9BACT